ncbi:MAG TPA: ABC transporter substrate-binding protein [Verrucomicrobiae bacterium]|jgi:ABC-type nitrate/sulfonate/bicarbonate transport system substrate-binding protein|nr:ABC transporter substrate-binding protein [Verrucomicrobiae bacterium]
MRKQSFALTIFFLFSFAVPCRAELKKVRLAVPTFDIITLPLKFAQVKGFYEKEGLDPEIILIAGALGVKAALANSVDFTTASGSILAAAVRGVGVKLVLVIASKPTFDLVAEPKIQSFQQLKGKLVGISTRGGTFEHLTRLMLEKNGLNPDKDVTIIALGRQDDLYLALKAGRITAAIYSPPLNLVLAREGFHKLAFSGDYLPHYPIGGLGVTDETVKRKPAEILAFVRGTLKGLTYYRQNRTESIAFIAKELKVSDETLAARMFDWQGGVLAENGRVDQAWMRGAIDFTKKSLDVNANIAPEQVFDMSFVEKSLR